jgi:hypothetical protein
MSERTRRPGERMPSRKLNEMINQLTDHEFADLGDLRDAEEKDAAFWRLTIWHRGRNPYDPDEEKAAFDAYNLYGLRKSAIKNITEGMQRIRFGLPRELESFAQDKASHSLEVLDQTLRLIASAKEFATCRTYFGRTAALLKLERRLVKRLLESDPLKANLRRILLEERRNKASIAFKEEIEHYQTYLQPLKSQYASKGFVNTEPIQAYYRTAFAKMEIDSYPAKLRMEKLRIDETFAYLGEQYTQACEFAERIYALHLEYSGLSPMEHAKLLWRLISYYDVLKDEEKSLRVLSYFEEVEPEKPENQRIYLWKYLFLMLGFALDTENPELADEAVVIFERNATAILEGSGQKEYLLLLISLLTYYLGQHDIKRANAMFGRIYQIKEKITRLLYGVQYRIAHLQLLFENNEESSLRLFARNYERFFISNLPFCAPALEILLFLRKQIKIENQGIFDEKRKVLTEKLQTWQNGKETHNSLWYGPFLNWLSTITIRERQSQM